MASIEAVTVRRRKIWKKQEKTATYLLERLSDAIGLLAPHFLFRRNRLFHWWEIMKLDFGGGVLTQLGWAD